MDIDNLEENLNNNEVNIDKVIEVLLNKTALNQAMLETLIDLNSRLLCEFTKQDMKAYNNQVFDNVSKRFLEIQAQIMAKF